MNISVTYHWTHLDYNHPGFRHELTWAPVAYASIKMKIKLTDMPDCEDRVVWEVYRIIEIPIINGADPQEQVIRGVKNFAHEQNIEIALDFPDKWADENCQDLMW